MNIFNNNPFTYKHAYNSRPIIIPSKSVLRGLSQAAADHCLRHNQNLRVVSDEEVLTLSQPVMEPTIVTGSAYITTTSDAAVSPRFVCDVCQKIVTHKAALIGHKKSHK